MRLDQYFYRQFGLDPIPLKPRSKKPWGVGGNMHWNSSLPNQWQGVPSDHNIGLRLNPDDFAILDADDRFARIHLRSILGSMGLIPEPTVLTGGQHRGAQFWINIEDKPVGVIYRRLNPYVGNGELRLQRCYCVVPESIVVDTYRFNVDARTTLQQRSILWMDIQKHLAAPTPTAPLVINPHWKEHAIPVLRRALGKQTKFVIGTLRALNQATKGARLYQYATRSEAMAAVVRIMLRFGWSWRGIRSFFWGHAPKYLSSREPYIRYTAAKFSAEMTPPALIMAYKTAAGLQDTGAKAIYRALISEAVRWVDGKHPFDPNSEFVVVETTDRQLGRLIDKPDMTANRWRKRIMAAGLLFQVKKGAFRKEANQYHLSLP